MVVIDARGFVQAARELGCLQAEGRFQLEDAFCSDAVPIEVLERRAGTDGTERVRECDRICLRWRRSVAGGAPGAGCGAGQPDVGGEREGALASLAHAGDERSVEAVVCTAGRAAGPSPPASLHVTVVYSEVYQAPVMHVRGHHADGAAATRDDIISWIPEPYAHLAREDKGGTTFLAPSTDPHAGVQAFMVHPCQTNDIMSAMRCADGGDGTAAPLRDGHRGREQQGSGGGGAASDPLSYMLGWMSVFAPVSGVRCTRRR